MESMEDNELDIETQFGPASQDAQTREAAFHRAIAPLLPKRVQGRVMGAWREVHGWNEARERPQFEEAMWAHYQKVRAERLARGTVSPSEPGAAGWTRSELLSRTASGEYIPIAVQHAWGGWKMARSGL